jgi:hypothetical protein
VVVVVVVELLNVRKGLCFTYIALNDSVPLTVVSAEKSVVRTWDDDEKSKCHVVTRLGMLTTMSLGML